MREEEEEKNTQLYFKHHQSFLYKYMCVYEIRERTNKSPVVTT